MAARRHGSWNSTPRSILPKSEVSSILVVITHVLIQEPSQVSPVEHHHMIQELAT
jgi:hypothetical protein